MPKKLTPYLAYRLKDDSEFLFDLAEQWGLDALVGASSALKEDREFMLAAVKHYGFALEYASDALKEDREVVYVAAKQNVWALHCASYALKADRDFMLAEIKKNARTFLCAPDYLQKDIAFRLAVFKQFTWFPVEFALTCMQVASESLKTKLPVEPVASFKQALSRIRPQSLTEEQLRKIDVHMQVLKSEMNASSNAALIRVKKEHIDALSEFKTLSQTMAPPSSMQQIERDGRFKHVKAGSRTYQLMDDIKNESLHTGLSK